MRKSVPNYMRITHEAKLSLPPNGNFNEHVKYLQDAAHKVHLSQQAAQKEQWIQSNFTENMTIDQYREAFAAGTEMEFRAAQSRKSNAGYAYQHIIEYLLEMRNLSVVSQDGSTIDKMVLSPNGDRCALLSVKRTLRERWSQEIRYSSLARSMGIPHFIITHDEGLTQATIIEMIAEGFDVVLQDHLIGNYKASPHLLAASMLPDRLRALTLRLRQAA